MTIQEIFYDKEKTRRVRDLRVTEDGQVLIHSSEKWQEFFVFGGSRILMTEPACVYASDSSRVYVKNSAKVYGHDQSTVFQRGNSEIYEGEPYLHTGHPRWGREFDKEFMRKDWNLPLVWLFDNSDFLTYGLTSAFLRDFSRIYLYSDSAVWRDDPDLPLSVKLGR